MTDDDGCPVTGSQRWNSGWGAPRSPTPEGPGTSQHKQTLESSRPYQGVWQCDWPVRPSPGAASKAARSLRNLARVAFSCGSPRAHLGRRGGDDDADADGDDDDGSDHDDD